MSFLSVSLVRMIITKLFLAYFLIWLVALGLCYVKDYNASKVALKHQVQVRRICCVGEARTERRPFRGNIFWLCFSFCRTNRQPVKRKRRELRATPNRKPDTVTIWLQWRWRNVIGLVENVTGMSDLWLVFCPSLTMFIFSLYLKFIICKWLVKQISRWHHLVTFRTANSCVSYWGAGDTADLCGLFSRRTCEINLMVVFFIAVQKPCSSPDLVTVAG